MFSFHKPKVYRSSTGCCICKAKSSSSRFTDSKKYEDDFMDCFQLDERRTGEICNACVLLVKRWKKLPTDSNRNWRHVVDARAGPGIKSLTKFKSKNKKKLKELPEKFEKIMKKKRIYLKDDQDREQSPIMSDDMNEDYLVGGGSKGSSRVGSPVGSDDNIATGVKDLNMAQVEGDGFGDASGFIDLTYFKREVTCCGIIFRGEFGEVIVDPSLIKRCLLCLGQSQQQRQDSQVSSSSPSHISSASTSPAHSSASASPAHSTESTTTEKPIGKTFSDSSSDSGYDDSSNPGVGEKLAKIIQNKAVHLKAIPITEAQLKAIPIAESVRLKGDVPIKLVQMQKIECKTISIAASNVVASVPNNPLVEFAIHASARQPCTN